ncbi:MAG: hypothetical protein QW179_04385 [Candidatus Hadarchaeales archaeon]
MVAGGKGGIEQILEEIRAIKERLDAIEKALMEREETTPEIILNCYTKTKTEFPIICDVLE